MAPGSWTSLSTPTRTAIFKHLSDKSDHVGANTAARLDQAAKDQENLAAAEPVLAEAEAFGAASDKIMLQRTIAARLAVSASTAAARASEEAALSTRRAREALRAARKQIAATNRRVPEVGTKAGGGPLAAPVVSLPTNSVPT